MIKSSILVGGMSTFFFLTNTKKYKIVNLKKKTLYNTFYLLLKEENTIMTYVSGGNFCFILKKRKNSTLFRGCF